VLAPERDPALAGEGAVNSAGTARAAAWLRSINTEHKSRVCTNKLLSVLCSGHLSQYIALILARHNTQTTHHTSKTAANATTVCSEIHQAFALEYSTLLKRRQQARAPVFAA
jgi:hypothetical protein